MISNYLFFSTFLLISSVLTHPIRTNKRYPVILVPGDGGSQFEGRLNKTSTVHYYCSKTSDWYTMWLSLSQALFADCLIDNMKLNYDNVSRKSYNQPGVEIRQPGFGNTSTVEWLDPTHPVFQYQFSYFYQIVDALVNKLNYTRDKDVRGAPYDFRKAPNEMSDFFSNLTALVEDTYLLNAKTPVTILSHSMGGLVVLYWLNNRPQKWKDQYLRSFISLGGPWGGSVKPLRLMASGDNLGVRVIFNPLQIRTLQRSLTSTAFLMPYDTLWQSNEVLVYRPEYNYTVRDYKRFFDDIGFPDGYLMREDTENLIKKLEHPGVETHCLYGVGLRTPKAFNYTWSKPNWMDYQPYVVDGDGDGTVNTRSLTACRRWVGVDKNYPVHMQEFNNTEHVGMLSSQPVMDYIIKVLTGT